MTKFLLFLCVYFLVSSILAEKVEAKNNLNEDSDKNWTNYVIKIANKSINSINNAAKIVYNKIAGFCNKLFSSKNKEVAHHEMKEEPKAKLIIRNYSIFSFLDYTIDRINEKIKMVEIITNKFSQQLQKDGDKVQKLFSRQINKQYTQAFEQINKFLDTAGNLNDTDCLKIENGLLDVKARTINKNEKCVTEIIKDAERHRTNILRLYNILLKNLTQIKTESRINVNQFNESKSKAILNMVETNGAWAIVNKVPELFINMSLQTLKMFNFVPKVSLCSTDRNTTIYYMSKIVKRVKDCVSQKLDEDWARQ